MLTNADLEHAGGTHPTKSDLDRISGDVALPPALVDALLRWPLVGVSFALDGAGDLSGLGVEMKWMNAAEIVSEATEVFPGCVAARLGYVPVGTCLEGSGDYYFFRARDGAIVRIPHDATDGVALFEERIELVAPSIAAFLELAAIA